ncbi:MAG: hypothetical protein QXD83_07540 [Sulfolobales archaeon]
MVDPRTILDRVNQVESNLVESFNLGDSYERREYLYEVFDKVKTMPELKEYLDEYNSELEKELERDVSYDLGFIVDDDDRAVITIDLAITDKYMEISETCSHSESEEEYDECYENALEEVNSECIADVDVSIVTEKVSVRSYAIECTGDYCRCGNEFEIMIAGDSVKDAISNLMFYYPRIIEIVKQVLRL